MPDLKGVSVLVTRPEDQSERLCQLVNGAGGRAIKLPSLKIILNKNITPEHIHHLLNWAGHIIFISRNAVSCLARVVEDIPAVLAGKMIYAVGRGTLRALDDSGVGPVCHPSGQYGSEELLELDELGRKAISREKVLIIRGDEGRELLGESLQARGAEVRYAAIYQVKMPEVARQTIDSIWTDRIPDIIVLTSSRGLQNLVEMTPEEFGKILFSRKLVVMSERIAETAGKAGFTRTPVIAEHRSDEGLIEAIQRSVEQE